MPVNLSVKQVPDHIAERLRQRAAANHRSMQGELMAILERELTVVSAPKLTISELAARVRATGLRTSSEAVQMIREDRDR